MADPKSYTKDRIVPVTLRRAIIAYCAIAAAAFGFFVFLAHTQMILVPYFTPTTIEFENLEHEYPPNGNISYAIKVKGYGSNCVSLKVSTVYHTLEGNENISYFYKADDCRYMTITQGPYNYTRTFNYTAAGDLGKIGSYTIEAEFYDQINKQKQVASRSFSII